MNNKFKFPAMLSGTLRTYHKNACDFDKIQLSCPRGTSITIEIAQYKKPSPGKINILFFTVLKDSKKRLPK